MKKKKLKKATKKDIRIAIKEVADEYISHIPKRPDLTLKIRGRIV